MAVSTPRRLIAEDASYGKISTPDGSRYESATAELGGMLIYNCFQRQVHWHVH